mmetsp:Transcript_10713/g.29781  ORF Transcript_10713/g.29781 Transcript_10713/m.29781 type:complete len:200 (-) Transcript_10713:523-1122(-)
MKANISPTTQSWRTSVPMVICACGWCDTLASWMHLTTMEVELMARSDPTNAPWYAPAPIMKAMADPMAAMSPTWRTPPKRATFRTALSFAKLSSKPSVKSKNWTPSCEMLCNCTISLASPNPPCPSSEPAMKYPLIVGCPSAAISWPARAEVMISRLMSRISWGSNVSPIDPSMFGFESTYSLSCESMILSTSDSTEAS